MRIKVLRDSKGRILATFKEVPDQLIQVEPIAEQDAKIEFATAPENYEFKLKSFYREIEQVKG
ncbi:hypothetical protein ACFLRN_10440 [Thermoproteota archaeon]